MEVQKNSDAIANRMMWLVSVSVLLASSTWFSGTAASLELRAVWHLNDAQSAWLTIAVQLGFIVGTFLYAAFNLADVYNARRVFFVSAILGAGFNAAFSFGSDGLLLALTMRFLTGLTLAGIYPVGMKIIASWFQSGLGWRLGVMVGALVLGTASPYLLQEVGTSFDWRLMSGLASVAAVIGAFIMLIGVKDGPFLSKRAVFNIKMMFRVFSHPPFRHTAYGYFGHMWELYAFWSLVAFHLLEHAQSQNANEQGIALITFSIIAIGALGCVIGGWVSKKIGERNVALVSLIISGSMCALSGFLFNLPQMFLIPLLLIWGFFVISDSPQFAALAAKHAPPEYIGTALTVQNGIGFAVTVVSIQLLPWIATEVGWQWAFLVLLPGPVFGAYYIRKV
jgi:MFS family permease